MTIRKLFSFGLFPLSLTGLLVFLMSTRPTNNNFLLVLVPIGLLWLTVFSMVMFVSTVRKDIHRLRLRILAATLATCLTLLTMFSALGQLSVFDVLLLASLGVLSIFYFHRSWPGRWN